MRTPGKFAAVKKKRKRKKENEKFPPLCVHPPHVGRKAVLVYRGATIRVQPVRIGSSGSSLTGLRLKSFPFPAIASNAMRFDFVIYNKVGRSILYGSSGRAIYRIKRGGKKREMQNGIENRICVRVKLRGAIRKNPT